ncbi:MAG TPA: NAD-binding protein [Burkholderiaceae bacterium]|jgi:voltage-gated potassium channel
MSKHDSSVSNALGHIGAPNAFGIAQLWRIAARVVWAAIILLALIVIGTVCFHMIGGGKSTWADAIYMTLITVSTVGYDEAVPLDTTGARIFAGLMGIAGLGVLTFLFTSMSVFFLEKDLDLSLRRRKMEQRIRKLKDHYIVCGLGRVGCNVAHELRNTSRPFVAIDPDQMRFDENTERFPDLIYLHGDASDDDLLVRAAIENAKGVFAVTGDDSRNMMIIITAKQINPAIRIVARAQETRNIEKMRKAGADEIICPDFTGGLRMASAMVRPHVVSFLDEMLKSETQLRVEEVVVPERFPPTRVDAAHLRGRHNVPLAVRVNGAWTFNPPDDFVLRAGDVIVIMATPAGRAELEAHLRTSRV